MRRSARSASRMQSNREVRVCRQCMFVLCRRADWIPVQHRGRRSRGQQSQSLETVGGEDTRITKCKDCYRVSVFVCVWGGGGGWMCGGGYLSVCLYMSACM